MRKYLPAILAASTLSLAVALGAPALAAGPDPTVDQIYQAVEAGHLAQAQGMIEEVLRDHPESGKAHYVQAELFAKEGKTAQARSELARAEELQPGLPKENPHSVAELKAQLGLGPRTSSAPHFNGAVGAEPARHFPIGTVLIFAVAILVLWMVFRRRTPTYPMGAVPGGGAPGYGGGPGYGGPMGGGYAGPAGGGIGSGIAGGLASGLAVGAGVVAGEELAHHFMDGGSREGGIIPPASAADNSGWEGSNNDSGGADFGINDPGSWDDGSSGGGGDSGGGDWS